MHEYRALIQKPQPIEVTELGIRLLIRPFTSMKYEGSSLRRNRACLEEIATEPQRMTPTIFLDHLYREISSL
jgi:hypothetical protein